jgi:hypothetical protein
MKKALSLIAPASSAAIALVACSAPAAGKTSTATSPAPATTVFAATESSAPAEAPAHIVYYNPLDSITIIYEETSSVPTLTKIGEITSDLSVFENLPGDVDMRIERG